MSVPPAREVRGGVPVPPSAGEFTHANLLDAVAAAIGVELEPEGRGDGGGDRDGAPAVPPQLACADLRGVVVLVVDGLGWHQLGATAAAPFLSSIAADQDTPTRAVLPSTTTTNLVAIGTGRCGGDHGILGYTMVLDGAVFNPLVWRYGLRGGGADARTTVVPEALVPRPTMLERLAADDVEVAVVLHPDFLDSGLTRAGLRGGMRLAAEGLHDSLRAALDVLQAADGPGVVYVHHPHVDTAGHRHGPHTPAWRAAVEAVDDVLRRVVATLPPDMAVVVTADHGMVAVVDGDVTEVHDDDPVLAGVRTVAGEPRLRTLVVEDGQDPNVVADRLAEALGDRAQVRTTRQAVAAGWFGDDVPDGHARRLGDVVAASIVGSVPHPRVDPHGGRLAGLHGSLTAAERDVPLLVLTG